MVLGSPGRRLRIAFDSNRRIIWWAEGPRIPKKSAISFSAGGTRWTFAYQQT